MTQVAVLGGGIVGLSIAWELAGRGADVVVLDRFELGKKASWAGAGILVPSNEGTATHPLEQLTGHSNRLHAEWSRRLAEETGIDNGYRQCGGVYLAWTAGEVASLVGMFQEWNDLEVPCEWMDADSVSARISGLANSEQLKRALWAPTEAQIRNPRHLQALVAGCRRRQVELVPKAGRIEIDVADSDSAIVRWVGGQRSVDHVVVAAGAWSREVVRELGVDLPIEPVRGQMLLYQLERPPFDCVVNVGSRYLMPRDDGHVLVGSTTEEVGFEETTTVAAIEDLKQFAVQTCSALTPDRCVRSWAGLRPAAWDGVPYIGRIPNFENVWIAAGHFKIGLQQSTGTAVLLADLIEDRNPLVDPAPFDPARVLVGWR